MSLTKAECAPHLDFVGCPEAIRATAIAAGWTWAQVLSVAEVAYQDAVKAWPIFQADLAAGKSFVQTMIDVLAVVVPGSTPPATV